MLYVMAERWKPACKYRNAFERVKEVLFDGTPYLTKTAPDITPPGMQSGRFVSDAVDAFFAYPQEVDVLLDNVLTVNREVQDAWPDLDGSSWVDNLGVVVDGEHSVPSWAPLGQINV